MEEDVTLPYSWFSSHTITTWLIAPLPTGEGVGVGRAVGVGDAVGLGVGVAVGLGDGVTGTGVGVLRSVGVGVGVPDTTLTTADASTVARLPSEPTVIIPAIAWDPTEPALRTC